MAFRWLSRLNTNCFSEGAFSSLKRRFLKRKGNRLEILLEKLEMFTNSIFSLIVKSAEINNKEFMSFRTRCLIEEHTKALCLLRADGIVVEEINNHSSKVGCYIVEEVENNEYGLSMECKECNFILDKFICNCSKYLIKKIFCCHIHIFI